MSPRPVPAKFRVADNPGTRDAIAPPGHACRSAGRTPTSLLPAATKQGPSIRPRLRDRRPWRKGARTLHPGRQDAAAHAEGLAVRSHSPEI
jgi:hypothetical protein